jgi:hypothetical protein
MMMMNVLSIADLICNFSLCSTDHDKSCNDCASIYFRPSFSFTFALLTLVFE